MRDAIEHGVRAFRGATLLFWVVVAAVGAAGCRGTSDLDPQPVTPQRPTFSSDTFTTAEGTVEVEVGVALDPTDSFDTPVTMKYGLSPTSEIFVGWSPYQWAETPGSNAEGVGDTVIGTRQRILQPAEEGGTAGAIQLATKLPTGSEREGLSSGELDLFASGILTRTVSNVGITGYYQLGFLGEADDSDFDLEHGFALAAGMPLIDEVSVFGEIAAVLAHEEDREEVFTTLGVGYALSPDFILDVAMVVGLSRDAADFAVLIGFTKNIGDVLGWLGLRPAAR